MSMGVKTVPAGVFKQRCLRLLDEVAATHDELVITKRGRPVAKVVPVKDDREREDEIVAQLRHGLRILINERELLQPLTDEAGWALDGED